MIRLYPEKNVTEPLNILCIGAHCDDIEIGCGATILKMLRERTNVNVYWLIFCSTEDRRNEAIAGAKLFCSGAARLSTKILGFRDGYLPYEGPSIKDSIEAVKRQFQPDIIFTHYRNDLHQDHRKVSELTWNTYRDHMILEYEIPKWDGDLSSPTAYVAIDDCFVDEKISALKSIYASQRDKHWFTSDLFRSIMRIRGMEAASPTGFAEAFYCRKLNLVL